MPKLVFLKRTQKEIELFGGDVFFDLDGKNAGKLTTEDQFLEVSAGKHTIKMYKSHSFDTYIGFAESTVEILENEDLMVRYAAPMMVNQPGNMVISKYEPESVDSIVEERDKRIERDYVAVEKRKEEQNKKYNNGVKWVIIIFVILAIIYAIEEAMIWSSF